MQTVSGVVPSPIVPIDDETSAMLKYAQTAEGRSKIAKARRELHGGKGIEATPEYFSDLNRRIAKRAEKKGSRKKK